MPFVGPLLPIISESGNYENLSRFEIGLRDLRKVVEMPIKANDGNDYLGDIDM